MNQTSTVEAHGETPTIKVSKPDLLAAWSILENLAVSLDQIGGVFGETGDGPVDRDKRLASLEALIDYLSPSLVSSINEARLSLGGYLDDEEAEAVADKIPYWDYRKLGG